MWKLNWISLVSLTVFIIILSAQTSLGQQNQRPNKRRFVQTLIPGLGKVKGRKIETAWTGQRIFQFFDIKYGQAPSGQYRFKAPRPAEPWSGVRNAFVPRKGCPSLQQYDVIKFDENKRDVEDCLFLTINTKNLSTSYPVMVYIHGEFLFDGTNLEAAPEYLLEKNIVLVSIRYRLAPFGFLSTMTDEIPGNAGILDVILALEWIQKNIYAFGGDPKRVTLFGQVGGASIINLLTMSPAVQSGLFHRVIYMSGSALTPVFITNNPVPFATDIAKRSGCKNTTIEKVNECLMHANASTLLEAFSQHGVDNGDKGIGGYGGLQFTIGGPSGVLPQHPGKFIREKKIRYYPTMGGVTKNAGTFLLKEIFEDNFNEAIPDNKYTSASMYIQYFISQTNGVDPKNVWTKFSQQEFFTTEELNNGTFQALLSGIIDMCGTIPFKNPLLLALQANAEALPNNTFLYSFDYEGEFNRDLAEEDDFGNPKLPFELGVSLTDDNIYLFPWPEHVTFLNKPDTRMAKRMVSLWTSFAKTGIPKAKGINWPSMTSSTGPYLKIDLDPSIGTNFLDEYTSTVRNARNGKTLLNKEYFERLNKNDNDPDIEEDEDDEQGRVENKEIKSSE